MRLTYFGQSAWGLTASGAKLVIDPWPSNDAAAAALSAFCDEALDHVLVTHAGFDHLGIALDILRERPRTTMLADVAVHRHALKSGVAPERVHVTGWNMLRELGPWRILSFEVKHASVIETVGGEYITGMPLGFLAWHLAEPDVRVMHLGDTSLFSDLALFGQLYAPMVGLLGVSGGPGLIEMNAAEAAQAALWLGVDVALPMHWTRDPGAAERFCSAVAHLPRHIVAWVPEIGASYEIERTTRIDENPRA